MSVGLTRHFPTTELAQIAIDSRRSVPPRLNSIRYRTDARRVDFAGPVTALYRYAG